MNTTSKWLAVVAVAFVAGSFVASPELRAFAANTVGSADIIDGSIQSADIGDGQVKTADLGGNSVTAAKIKDGEVKAAEIATDAVGAAEIQGVNKLLFGQCQADSTESVSNVSPGALLRIQCSINGVDADDTSAAAMSGGNACFGLTEASTNTNRVDVYVRNFCSTTERIGLGTFGIIVFDK